MTNKTIPVQLEMAATVSREIDGIEMGVLDDGTPFLTSRGLAMLCGVAPSVIIKLTAEWENIYPRKRGQKILQLLAGQGHDGQQLALRITLNGKPTNAHPDAVCMAILEYYAFESDSPARVHAMGTFRFLARQSLKQFIYGRLGYDPAKAIPEAWRQYHDRMTMNSAPAGRFSVFREISNIIITGIQSGMSIDANTMPDISVGQIWARHWKKESLSEKYGEREKHDHNFPDYFPQKDTVEAWVYPLAALGEFRLWLQRDYLPKKFPNYLRGKASKGALPVSSVELILQSVSDPLLGQ